MKKYVFLFAAAIFIFGVVSTAHAQYFPDKKGMDKLEKETEKAEKKQVEAEKRADEIKKKKEANEKIWKKYSDIRKTFRARLLKSANSGRPAKTLATLNNVKYFYHRGKVLYHLEQWKKASNDFKKVIGDKFSRYHQNAEAVQYWTYSRLAGDYDGEEFDSKIEKKVVKTVDYLQKRYIPSEEKKNVLERKDDRLERLARLKIWVGDYLAKVKKCEEILKKIKENPRNSDLIWQLFHYLEDEMHLSLRAQEWLEILIKEFKDTPYVELGYADAYRATYLGRCGNPDKAVSDLSTLRANDDKRRKKVANRQAAIKKKMKDEKIGEKDLTPEERKILKIELGEQRDRLRRIIRHRLGEFRESVKELNKWEKSK